MRTWIALLLTVGIASHLATGADEATPEGAPAAETEDVEVATTSEEGAEPAQPVGPTLPLQLHCGQLISIVPATEAETVDMQKALAAGNLEPDAEALPDTLRKTPATGMAFAVAEIRLAAKQSVGRTDFILRHGSQESKCLALGDGSSAFDERLWELAEGTARLLFEVPQETHAVSLEYAPDLRVKLPGTGELPFGDQPLPDVQPPPNPTPVEQPAAPAATPTQKPKPAAKPTPEPVPEKAAPKPTPKKPKPADDGAPLF